MDRLGWLRTWPLLIAALAAIIAGTKLLTSTGGRELAAVAILTVGAVLVGAWISLLASHDYPGHEDIPPPDVGPATLPPAGPTPPHDES